MADFKWRVWSVTWERGEGKEERGQFDPDEGPLRACHWSE